MTNVEWVTIVKAAAVIGNEMFRDSLGVSSHKWPQSIFVLLNGST